MAELTKGDIKQLGRIRKILKLGKEATMKDIADAIDNMQDALWESLEHNEWISDKDA